MLLKGDFYETLKDQYQMTGPVQVCALETDDLHGSWRLFFSVCVPFLCVALECWSLSQISRAEASVLSWSIPSTYWKTSERTWQEHVEYPPRLCPSWNVCCKYGNTERSWGTEKAQGQPVRSSWRTFSPSRHSRAVTGGFGEWCLLTNCVTQLCCCDIIHLTT